MRCSLVVCFPFVVCCGCVFCVVLCVRFVCCFVFVPRVVLCSVFVACCVLFDVVVLYASCVCRLSVVCYSLLWFVVRVVFFC